MAAADSLQRTEQAQARRGAADGQRQLQQRYFSADRRRKYGLGTLRLSALLLLALTAAPAASPNPAAAAAATAAYLRSGRWLGHAFVGAAGAVVNVEALPLRANLALLVAAALFTLLDAYWFGLATPLYLAKVRPGADMGRRSPGPGACSNRCGHLHPRPPRPMSSRKRTHTADPGQQLAWLARLGTRAVGWAG